MEPSHRALQISILKENVLPAAYAGIKAGFSAHPAEHPAATHPPLLSSEVSLPRNVGRNGQVDLDEANGDSWWSTGNKGPWEKAHCGEDRFTSQMFLLRWAVGRQGLCCSHVWVPFLPFLWQSEHAGLSQGRWARNITEHLTPLAAALSPPEVGANG